MCIYIYCGSVLIWFSSISFVRGGHSINRALDQPGSKIRNNKKISKHIKILKNITIHYKKNYHKYHTSQYIRGYYYYWTNMYRYYKACYIFNHQVSTHRLPVSPTAPFSLGTLPFLVVLLHYSLNL